MKTFRVVLYVGDSKQWVEVSAKSAIEAGKIALKQVMVVDVREM